jgi:hypothetical protein
VSYIFYCAVLRIQIRKDLYHFWEADPDLHQNLMPEPDRIRIKVKIHDLWRLKVELWMAVDASRLQ